MTKQVKNWPDFWTLSAAQRLITRGVLQGLLSSWYCLYLLIGLGNRVKCTLNKFPYNSNLGVGSICSKARAATRSISTGWGNVMKLNKSQCKVLWWDGVIWCHDTGWGRAVWALLCRKGRESPGGWQIGTWNWKATLWKRRLNSYWAV